MIRPLRRLHRTAWSVLALLLPIGFVAAYLAIPEPVVGRLPTRAIPTALETVVATIDRPDAMFLLRTDEGAYQLEVVLKRPLQATAILVHALTSIDAEATDAAVASDAPVIGRIGSQNVYRFDLGSERQDRFLLRDPIRGEVVGRIDFAESARADGSSS